MSSTEVFRVDAHNMNAAQVAAEFARTYWDVPRKVENLRSGYPWYFEVENGTATYKIVYVPAVPLVAYAYYKIVRL